MKHHSPAAERNGQPILEALQQVLPAHGVALEVASGTGQHVALFARNMPGWTWHPSDATPDGFGSIEAWCADAGRGKVRAPVVLDVLAPHWPGQGEAFEEPFDAIFCANLLHIAPWTACAGLMCGAARHLAPDGHLLTYGPYLEQSVATAPGNLAFDQSLRGRNPAWGIRALQDVAREAEAAGLLLRRRVPMPANNLLLVFGRAPGTMAVVPRP
jgi:hypothetical protein